MKQENFDELFKQRLSKSEVTPPDALWSRIEGSMAQIDKQRENLSPQMALRRPKHILNRRTVWGYVAAASLLVGVIIAGLNRVADNQMIADADVAVENSIDEVVESVPSNSTHVGNIMSDVVRSAVAQPLQTSTTTAKARSVAEEKIATDQSSDSTEISPKVAPPVNPTEKKSSQSEVANQPSKRVTHNVFAEERPSKRKKDGFGVGVYAMNLGTGSSVVASGGVAARSSFLINEAISVSDGPFSSYVFRTPTPELKHKMPMSYGLSVSYDLGGKLSIESGLVYTKLYSESSSAGSFDFNYKIKQDLQYLGVPLSIRYKVVNKSLFSLYIKGGAMVEMAVGARRTEIISDVRASSKLNVNGVQASIHGALGAQLNVTKGLGLYVEPGVAYYFDCGQPDNYRTENPVNFALTAGLRINIR